MSDISLNRWIEIKSVVQEALELPRADRASLLSKSCGEDQELRKEVEAYLAVSETQAQHFDAIRIVPHTLSSLPAGAQVGPFTIESPLGEGGMGIVYLARDEKHDRQVALKLVSRGTARAEPQLMAQLSHPNIATLYDSGETEKGISYFAMEYVDGVTLTKYCEENKVALDDRLKLFCVVCRAVAYAHRHLIVHRDLTPNNILVTEDGTPKLLDFGIAKQIDTDRTMTATQPGLRAMTVAFSSPEHIAGGRAATTSDIYSLGVLLCLLLTGRLPYQTPRHKLLQAVQDGEVSAPSTVFSPSVEDGYGTDFTIAEQGRSLKKELQGDLDAIVLKALRLEPEKRYESAGDLVEDVRRHLASEPVNAHHGSVQYRFGKFLKRHRKSLSATFIVLIALVGFVIYRAEQQKETARALARAEAVNAFMLNLFEKADPNHTHGKDLTVRELLDLGVEEAKDKLAEEPEVQASLLTMIGGGLLSLGFYEDAEKPLMEAMQIREMLVDPNAHDLADSYLNVGWYFIESGDYEQARQYTNMALRLFQGSNYRADPGLPEALNQMAALEMESGDIKESARLMRDAYRLACERNPDGENNIDFLYNLGTVLLQSSEYEEARGNLKTVILKCESSRSNRPLCASARESLAMIHLKSGDLRLAEEMMLNAVSLRLSVQGREHPHYARALTNLGEVYRKQGRDEEALSRFSEALEIQEEKLGDHPKVAVTLNNMGLIYAKLSRFQEAEEFLTKSIEIHKKSRGGENLEVGIVMANLANVYGDQGDLERAEAMLRESYRIRVAARGSDSSYAGHGAAHLGANLFEQGRLREAKDMYEQALVTFISVDGLRGRRVGRVKHRLAKIYIEKGELEEAQGLLEDAFRILREHADPLASESGRQLVEILEKRGGAEKLKKYRELLAIKQ